VYAIGNRIRSGPDPDSLGSGRPKMVPKKENSQEISCFEEPFRWMEAFLELFEFFLTIIFFNCNCVQK
jgi:hypothetical protein